MSKESAVQTARLQGPRSQCWFPAGVSPLALCFCLWVWLCVGPGLLPTANNSSVKYHVLLSKRESEPHLRMSPVFVSFTSHPLPPFFILVDKSQGDDLAFRAFTVYHRLCLTISWPQSGTDPSIATSVKQILFGCCDMNQNTDQTSNLTSQMHSSFPKICVFTPSNVKENVFNATALFLFLHSLSF